MPSACAWIWPKAPTIRSFSLMLTAWSRSIHCTSSWLLPYEPVLVTSVKSNGGSYGRQRLPKTSWAVPWRLCRLCKLQKFEQVTACWKCTSCTFIPWLPRTTSTCWHVRCGMSWLLLTFPENHSFMTSVINWNQGGMMQDACKVKIKFQNFNSDVKLACSRGPFKGHWVNQGHSN